MFEQIFSKACECVFKLSGSWYVSKTRPCMMMIAYSSGAEPQRCILLKPTAQNPLVRLRAEAFQQDSWWEREKQTLRNGASRDVFVISIMDNFPSGTNLLFRTLPAAPAAPVSLYRCVKHLSDAPADLYYPRTAAVNLKTASVRFTCCYSWRGEKLPKTRSGSEFLSW